MVALRDEGLIGGIGLSTVTLDEYRQGTAATTIACVQNAYSVADRSDQAVYDACATDGVPYVPYFPLGSAFLRRQAGARHPDVVAVAERLEVTPAQVRARLAAQWWAQRAVDPGHVLDSGTSRRTWPRRTSSSTRRRSRPWVRGARGADRRAAPAT